LLLTDNLEDLDKQLPTILEVENNKPTTSTYSSMKTSGKLKLIEDLSLQKKISDYYEGLVLESIKKGDYQADYFTTELLSWLTNNVDLVDMTFLKTDELIILRNKLFIYASILDQKVETYEMIVEDSKQLKVSIESILSLKYGSNIKNNELDSKDEKQVE
jgi:hypothetical protein